MGMAGATTKKPVFEENCALCGASGRRTCRGHQVIPFSRCSRTAVVRVSLNQSIGTNTRPFYESTSAIISIYLHLPHIKHLPHICSNIWPSSRLCSTRRRLTVNLSLHPPLAREKSCPFERRDHPKCPTHSYPALPQLQQAPHPQRARTEGRARVRMTGKDASRLASQSTLPLLSRLMLTSTPAGRDPV